MRSKLGILFLHHDTDAQTRRNLESIKSKNRGAFVVTMSADKPFKGGYSLNATPMVERFHSLNPSRSSDWLVCSWFVQRKESCHKWWIVEWDTFARISVSEYYRPVWKYPFIASSVRLLYRESEWFWFHQTDGIPNSYRPYMIGAVPFLYLVSEKVIKAACSTLLRQPMTVANGELRFATAANKCGFAPCGYSPPNDRITWVGWRSVPKEPAIFHPVKWSEIRNGARRNF